VGTSAAEEIESIRRQQTELNASIIRAYLADISDLRAEAAGEFIVGACERMAIWCERHPEITPDLATEYTLDILWSGLQGKERTLGSG
jgi:hypothetical protein